MILRMMGVSEDGKLINAIVKVGDWSWEHMGGKDCEMVDGKRGRSIFVLILVWVLAKDWRLGEGVVRKLGEQM